MYKFLLSQVHLRPDFEPWIPIDIGMDREERNKIFEKAECRKTPMLFIDDCYVGGYDEVKLKSNQDFQISCPRWLPLLRQIRTSLDLVYLACLITIEMPI